MIEQFVQANPFEFDTAELQIVRSWKCALAGSFYVFRYLKQHTVFLSSEGQPRAYGVLALADPMEAVIGPHPPLLAQTVLLPLLDKIVYDGLIACYPISFGGGIKKMLNDTYKRAKAKHGIITSLPLGCQKPQPEDQPEAVCWSRDFCASRVGRFWLQIAVVGRCVWYGCGGCAHRPIHLVDERSATRPVVM